MLADTMKFTAKAVFNGKENGRHRNIQFQVDLSCCIQNPEGNKLNTKTNTQKKRKENKILSLSSLGLKFWFV